MVRKKKDKKREMLIKRENIRNSASKKRAENIKKAKSQSNNIGENIDLFLEVSGEIKNREITAPLIHDQHELRKAGENGINLPPKFNRTKIVLLTRDPEWIYAYWEITREKLDNISDFIGVDTLNNSQMILRVYDITNIDFDGNNSNSYFDITIEGKVSNWYIHVPDSGREYCVETGLRLPDNKFLRIARSNSTLVPRSGISDSDNEKWAVRDDEFVKLYEIAGGEEKDLTSNEIGKNIINDLKSSKHSPIPNRMEHLSSELIYMQRNLNEELSSASLGKEKLSSDIFYGEIGENEKLSSESLYSASLIGGSLSSESLYSASLMGENLSSEILSSEVLSSEILSSEVLSSENLSSSSLQIRQGKLSIEEIERLSAAKKEGIAPSEISIKKGNNDNGEEGDDFWLVVNTELILYGATEPDAHVTVKGHPIKLREDGTFSFRFTLPDGEQNLEVRAVKHNGNHKRKITPKVVKWTE